MRLYLSSYQMGDSPELFSAMVGGIGWGWIIMNALDGADTDADHHRTDTVRQAANLGSIGLHAEALDLREFHPGTIESAFGEPDFVWVRGGNVFTLRMAMARSGFDQLIVDRLATDAFVYAGFSAGACVLAPSLAGLELCDSVADCRATYGSVRFDGLEVLDRPVVPHLDSPHHPESDVLSEVAARYKASGQRFWPLRDGQALLVDGGDPEIHA